jgi:hypothetical protein
MAVCLKAYHGHLATRRRPKRPKDTICNHENRIRVAIIGINGGV